MTSEQVSSALAGRTALILFREINILKANTGSLAILNSIGGANASREAIVLQSIVCSSCEQDKQ